MLLKLQNLAALVFVVLLYALSSIFLIVWVMMGGLTPP
jgi:hypothetical protein